MRFEKWHGAGNAYLVLERPQGGDPIPAAHVRRICDPDLGAGSDGILEILPSAGAHARIRIYNPDGGIAEFSGNGSRIAIGYLARRDHLTGLTIETDKGLVEGKVDGDTVSIDAGRAALEGNDHRPGSGSPPALDYRFVSLGNPHCVVRSDDLDSLDLRAAGEPIERHPWFPNRANVEFYRPLGEHDIRMRVWERGAGETRSSGSGSSAAAVAAVVAGHVQSPVTVHADGGTLLVDVGPELEVRLTGPVQPILAGAFDAAFERALETA